MPVIISRWYGRLGNNIHQVYHGLMEAIERRTWLIIPESPWWKSMKIDTPNNTFGENYIPPDDYLFTPVRELRVHSDTARDILRREFVYDVRDVSSLGEGSTIVNIRSGDVFTNPRSASGYAPPPLAYYTKIMRMYDRKRMAIIAEDAVNPVVLILARHGEVQVCAGRSLDKDVVSMLGAETLVMSVGTLVPGLVILSKNCTRVVCPSYLVTDERFRWCIRALDGLVTMEFVDIPGYVDSMYPWNGTRDQINNIVTYKLS